MTAAYDLSSIVSFTVITCYKAGCHIAFGVDATVRQRWIDSGQQFYCPNGHDQHYTESTVARLTKQLELEKKTAQRLLQEKEFAQKNATAERLAREHTERQLRTRKGINTRLRNRIKHGVCPCCHRTVSQLARHMKTKHPQFNKDDGGK